MKNNIKNYFPIFKKNKSLVYFDNSGTSLKPYIVIKGINDYYNKYSINNHINGNSSLENKVREVIKKTKYLLSKNINSNSKEIFFFPSATYALNILALSLESILNKGDEIFLTNLEHSSNYYPWQSISIKKGAKILFLPLNDKFIIDIFSIKKLINIKTKIVSFSHLNNSLGTINKVKEITKIIKKINPDCLVILDCCQSFSHLSINVIDWKIDALVFSAHKVYGPTGIGILWIKEELNKKIPDILWGGGKIYGPNFKHSIHLNKFEVGTLPIAQIFGLKKALDFLSYFDLKEKKIYQKNLIRYAIKELLKLNGIEIYNEKCNIFNIILFNIKGYHSHDLADYLGKNNVIVRSGNFCCPNLKKVINVESSLRISISFYNDRKDIDILINFINKLIKNPNLIISL